MALIVESGSHKDIAVLERSFEHLAHLVFKGTNTGLMHRIYPDQVASEERLQDTLTHLRKKPWMTDVLFEQFKNEVEWLRSQS